jgi:pantoate--beta-alanine ligase
VLTVTEPADLRRQVETWRREGLRVGFVPTMGALHEGHLSLVRRAAGRADRVVASIFVNPAQFDRPADLAAYPRTPEADAALLAGAGCHLLFLPDAETLYPPGHATWVEVAGPPAEGLEGAHRPGHFRGVATVVTLLLGLVRPAVAVFGEKDAQQLALVRRLVADLHLGLEVLAGPTVREPDGLALSSRNVHLRGDDRRAAAVLSRALAAARETVAGGERRAAEVRRRMAEVLAAEPRARVDYAEVVDAATFRPIDTLRGRVVLPLAVFIGPTRLIDNLHLDLDAPDLELPDAGARRPRGDETRPSP